MTNKHQQRDRERDIMSNHMLLLTVTFDMNN